MMKIGNKLRGLRAEKDFTTIYMAEKLGVSEPTYRRYENDKSVPDIEMINRLAIILDKSFLDLLPSECFVQNNNEQKGGVVVNLGTINNLSEKLIEQYEERIKDLKEIINNQKNK